MAVKVTSLRFIMAEKIDKKELVFFKEMIIINSIQTDATAQLLID
jgi:hypothetical protein